MTYSERIINFFRLEAAGGVMLFVATILALAIANSPAVEYYNFILKEKHLAHWINDGLMAIFFFVVGLEIKREVKEGALASVKSAAIPFVAAIGGIVVPAGIFYFLNMNESQNLRGFAIPTATDIAFSLGVLALIGSRAPLSLKILLTAIAIIDDLAAILIIAVFYTNEIDILMLALAALALLVMVLLNIFKAKNLWPYLVMGGVMWLALLNSGVHPTMAGVATAFCVPIMRREEEESWVDRLIHILHPYTAFFILPIFAFANAGVSFKGMTLSDLSSPLTLGIIAGLCLGKAVGITAVLSVLRPAGLSLPHIIALGFLCGIGFTMSLFIGELAFSAEAMQNEVRLGVMIASIVSACLAFILLKFSLPQNR